MTNTYFHKENAASYAERPPRQVPGFDSLHRMVSMLLAERASGAGRILVLGAGGGLELQAFAAMQPGWRFDGVDPSSEMLRLASATLGELASRVALHHGYIDSAPEGPFDGATCLLTLHFLPRDERLATLKELYRRLKPGAVLVVAHHSFPQTAPHQETWLRRNAAYGIVSGVPVGQAENSMRAFRERLPVLSPQEDAGLLHEAGFVNVELFYCAFTFRGWTARKP